MKQAIEEVFNFREMVGKLKDAHPDIREMVLEKYRELGGVAGIFDRSHAKFFLEALTLTEDAVEFLGKAIRNRKDLIREVRRPLEAYLYP